MRKLDRLCLCLSLAFLMGMSAPAAANTAATTNFGESASSISNKRQAHSTTYLQAEVSLLVLRVRFAISANTRTGLRSCD